MEAYGNVGFFVGGNMATEQQKMKFMQIYQAALNAGETHPEIVAAQWALESGWGEKQSGRNNYFGIKATNGEKGSKVNTHEVINGKRVSLQDSFKDYDTLEEGIADRVNFTQRNPRYRRAGYFDASSPAEAAYSLQKAGYATDPNYANSLINIIKGVGLDPHKGQQYDYSTTKAEPMAQQPVIPQAQGITPNIAEQLATLQTPKQGNSFADYFNQLNNTLEPLQPIEPIPQQSNRLKYQEKLAQAFGVQPEIGTGLPDHISGLVKSIYDQV